VPAILAICGLTASILLWQAFVNHEKDQSALVANAQARSTSRELQRGFQAVTQGFIGMAQRHGAALREGREFHLELTGLEGTAWVEPSGKVLRVDPPEGNHDIADADLAARAADRAALLKARESGQPAVTRSVALRGGTPGFHVMVPMSDGGRLSGFIVAVFSERAVERAVLEYSPGPGWDLAIFEDEHELYRTGSPTGGRWLAESTFKIVDAQRRLRASPGPEVIAQLHSPLPVLVLATGVAISLLLAASVALAQGTWRRAREAESANAALRESEARKSAVIEASLDGIVMMDWRGNIADLNAAAEKSFGYSRAEAIGRPLADLLIPQRLRDLHRKGLEAYLTTGKGPVIGRRVELSALRSDGTEFPVELSIVPVRTDVPMFLGFIRDLTAQKRAEEARLQGEEERNRLAALVESSNDAIISKNLDGVITSWNKGAERVFGYPAEEAIGRSIALLVPPGRAGEEPGILERIKRGEPIEHFTTVRRRKDGQDIDVSVAISPIRNRAGEVVGASKIARDISYERSLEELRLRSVEIEAQSRQNREANRLKSEFLANMSHELRTPLNAIIGFAELMHDGKTGPVSTVQAEFLGDILTSSRHLLQLINDVLDLSKVEAGKMEFRPEPLQMDKVVGEITAILRALAAKKRIEITNEINPGPGEIVVDPGKLKQVLYNYLSNAIKFTPEGGQVTVRATAEDAEQFRLEVEDTGIGIAEEDVPRLFKEFQQVDSSTSKAYPGTGLGLALTKRIVEAQGGRVGVRSTRDHGSTFFAVLPRISRPGPTAEEALGAREGAAGAPTILVIEDDTKERAWLLDILASAGYGVELAATGREAVERCRERVFQGITLDLLMPDMLGWDVLREIRCGGRNQATPVIVVTVVAEKGAAAGFAIRDYLVKPVQAEQLLASLERVGVLPTGSGPILVVDDDQQARKLMQTTLESLGYRVSAVAGAEEGLRVAGTNPPAAVILDLVMPEMDGFAFLDQFNRTGAARVTPVIVWTAKDLTPEEHRLLALSAQAVVLKGKTSTMRLIEELRVCVGPPAGPGTAEVTSGEMPARKPSI
jgi:PAS domain S-box-containing protein